MGRVSGVQGVGPPESARMIGNRLTGRPMKITEIKVTAGKDVFLFSPKAAQVIVGGKAFFLPDKLAAKLFKAIAVPAEHLCEELGKADLGKQT